MVTVKLLRFLIKLFFNIENDLSISEKRLKLPCEDTSRKIRSEAGDL